MGIYDVPEIYTVEYMFIIKRERERSTFFLFLKKCNTHNFPCNNDQVLHFEM